MLTRLWDHSRRDCSRLAALGCALALAMLGGLPTASAHPHVIVVATATVNIEHGAITSISHTWTFDEFYTAQAVDGLPKNKDGGYDRATLADLTKVNIEGLKEFGYFTFATLGKIDLKVGDPAEGQAWSDYKDGSLALHFTVPLDKPIPIEAKGFAVMVTDPSYFIAFEMSEKDPPKLNDGAPKNCTVALEVPRDETSTDEKRLTGAFADQMAPANLGLGTVAKSIVVRCGG